MRFLKTLINDIRYQIKYGFYFLYTFMSAIYIAILILIPRQYKELAASIIILTDPAMLGLFFIGGIWLLEKGEDLHKFWRISPLKPIEYIVSKAISLALISTISSVLIVRIGVGNSNRLLYLSISVFIGSIVFNIIGLIVGSYARSINHYMIIVVIPTLLLSVPPLAVAFGFAHPLLDVLPGTALWKSIAGSIHITENTSIWHWLILVIWGGIALLIATIRISNAMQFEGGENG